MKQVNAKQIISLYIRHAWHYKAYVIGLLVSTPIAVLTFRTLPPLLAAVILQRLSSGDFEAGQAWQSFGHDIVIYSLVTLFGGIIAWRIVVFLIWKLEMLVTRDLDQAMFDKFTQLSAGFHADNFGGSLVSQAQKLHAGYIRLADTFTFQLYSLFWAFVFISVILYDKALPFVIGMWLFTIGFMLATTAMTKHIRMLSAIEASAHTKTTGKLADAITNVMAIKGFSASRREQLRFSEALEDRRRKTTELMWGTLKRDTFSSVVTGSILVMAVILSVYLVVNRGADVATVFLMLTYSIAIGDRLWEFSTSSLRQINKAIGDAQEAVETLMLEPKVNDPATPEKLRVHSGQIDFKDVNFAHDDDADDSLFENFNLQIKDGEKVGLVGRSGGGKTTLTKLLLRFMDIDNGEILIDGQNIQAITQDDLRSVTTYVPQEPLLFHRSLSDNIAYGKPDATEAEIRHAAKLAHAHEFIRDLPQGYDTLVGERGVKLSGGQRQRVVIARAMLKQAPILVLDEATSALDSESELLIQDALWKLMEGKTAIVIAHRLSTIQKMDRIIVLDDGKVVEQGTHRALLRRKGVYAKLWAHQSGGFIED